MSTADDFVAVAMTQRGDRYTWGGDNPRTGFDCSGLINWACQQLGIVSPRTAAEQSAWCQSHGTTMSVTQALITKGALLFRVGVGSVDHVVISLGDGTTFEARGRSYGVNVFPSVGRVWTGAGRVPGLAYPGYAAGAVDATSRGDLVPTASVGGFTINPFGSFIDWLSQGAKSFALTAAGLIAGAALIVKGAHLAVDKGT